MPRNRERKNVCPNFINLTGPYFVAFPNLREAVSNNTPIRTMARSCTILPNFVGCVFFPEQIGTKGPLTYEYLSCRVRFLVHNGKDYLPVNVTQDMVGHKLGEFSHTKKRFTYRWVLYITLPLMPSCFGAEATFHSQDDEEQVMCIGWGYITTSNKYRSY